MSNLNNALTQENLVLSKESKAALNILKGLTPDEMDKVIADLQKHSADKRSEAWKNRPRDFPKEYTQDMMRQLERDLGDIYDDYAVKARNEDLEKHEEIIRREIKYILLFCGVDGKNVDDEKYRRELFDKLNSNKEEDKIYTDGLTKTAETKLRGLLTKLDSGYPVGATLTGGYYFGEITDRFTVDKDKTLEQLQYGKAFITNNGIQKKVYLYNLDQAAPILFR